jgi:hypothetical protein
LNYYFFVAMAARATPKGTQQSPAYIGATSNDDDKESHQDLPARYDDLKAYGKVPERTLKRRTQEKSDHIESLKLQIEEADKEDKRLGGVVEQRKQTLKRLQSELKPKEGLQEYTIKPAKAQKKGKKK